MKTFYFKTRVITLVFLTATTIFLTTKTAISGENCNDQLSINDHCIKIVKNLLSINDQLNKAFSSGGLANISQPPLVIVPEIEINAPTDPNSEQTITIRPKTIIRSGVKKKQILDKNYFVKIINALDSTGKKHLKQCLKKISDSSLGEPYTNFSNEIDILKNLAFKNSDTAYQRRKFFSKSPSQNDCLKYLDFILMIS